MGQDRRYIGSRYVPVFAEPAEWSSARTYEPLTIVLDGLNSYTSKQYVPKGVALTDENYWALTANYNAQVEDYRKTVQKYVDKETAIASGTVLGSVTIGDGIDVDNGRISVPDASKTVKGIAQVGTGINVSNGVISASPESVGAAAAVHEHAASDVTSGTLAVARGGTGLSASPSLLTNLASTTAANVLQASPRPGVTGVLPVANGGTGASSANTALSNLGALSTNDMVIGSLSTDSAKWTWIKLKSGFAVLSGEIYPDTILKDGIIFADSIKRSSYITFAYTPFTFKTAFISITTQEIAFIAGCKLANENAITFSVASAGDTYSGKFNVIICGTY